MRYKRSSVWKTRTGDPPIAANFAPPPVETGVASSEGVTSLELRQAGGEGRLEKGNGSGPESLED